MPQLPVKSMSQDQQQQHQQVLLQKEGPARVMMMTVGSVGGFSVVQEQGLVLLSRLRPVVLGREAVGPLIAVH